MSSESGKSRKSARKFKVCLKIFFPDRTNETIIHILISVSWVARQDELADVTGPEAVRLRYGGGRLRQVTENEQMAWAG
jgi:hypothetical protein